MQRLAANVMLAAGVMTLIFVSLLFQIFPSQFLLKVRHDALCDQHGVPAERPDPQAASAARRPDFRHKQVLITGEAPPPCVYCRFVY